MSISMTTLLWLAFGLSMDAFAVSVTNGMCYRMNLFKNALASGLAFGFFQGLMPLIGYVAGNTFSDIIAGVDHWIALLLLGFIGGRMLIEALAGLKKRECVPMARMFSMRTLAVQAVSTSIDALAVGVTLGVMRSGMPVTIGVIALITFCCSFLGVLIGKSVGGALKGKAEILGGLILILIGLRIFLSHIGIL